MSLRNARSRSRSEAECVCVRAPELYETASELRVERGTIGLLYDELCSREKGINTCVVFTTFAVGAINTNTTH